MAARANLVRYEAWEQAQKVSAKKRRKQVPFLAYNTIGVIPRRYGEYKVLPPRTKWGKGTRVEYKFGQDPKIRILTIRELKGGGHRRRPSSHRYKRGDPYGIKAYLGDNPDEPKPNHGLFGMANWD
jgi:hypothetical protein